MEISQRDAPFCHLADSAQVENWPLATLPLDYQFTVATMGLPSCLEWIFKF
jgi:hypothetical protein